MLILTRTSKFTRHTDRIEGGGLQTRPTEWLLRRKQHLLTSHPFWIPLSLLDPYGQSRLWRVWQCCLQVWLLLGGMPALGIVAIPGTAMRGFSDPVTLLFFQDIPPQKIVSIISLRSNWSHQVLHYFSRWPCEESAKIRPGQQQAAFPPPKPRNKQYAFGRKAF